MGMHLESTLTLQTKKRYISRIPTDPESLRTKYRVMTNLWLLAQLRQPGRQLYADLAKDTFNDFLEELLSTDNFLMKRQIEGETWAASVWTHCMEYEFQLIRDAIKLSREQGYSIQAALWATYRDQEHWMKHWVTLLSIANSRSEGTSDKAAREIEQLKKQVAQLQKARSRSPRGAKGSGKSSRSYPALQDSRGQLALLDSSASSSNKGKAACGHGEKEKSSSSKSVRFSIRARLPSSKKLGTRLSKSTTKRDWAFASRSKVHLVQDRIAGSIIIAQVVTKLVFPMTIVCAWLTSGWMPRHMVVGTRRLPTSWSIVENFVVYCWFLQALSTGLSYWKVGVYNRTSSETVGFGNWFTAFSTRRWTDNVFCPSLASRSHSIGLVRPHLFAARSRDMSRAQHFGNGQKPLRSSTEPFGLQSLDPNSISKVTAWNQQLEFVFWFLKEAPTCPSKVGVILVFPEDLGWRLESGPSSIWDCMIQVPRRLSRRSTWRSVSLPNWRFCPQEAYGDLHEPGWNFQFHSPWLARTDFNCSRPRYIIVLFRPLAESLHLWTEAKGISRYFSDGSFLSQSALGLSSKFWHRCFTNLEPSNSLRDGEKCGDSVSGSFPSLSSVVSSLNLLYTHWKERKLCRSVLKDFALGEDPELFFKRCPGGEFTDDYGFNCTEESWSP